MKAVFDLALNDYIEMSLLDRRIAAYWNKKARDEQQREKVRQSLQQYNNQWRNTPFAQQPERTEEQVLPPSFLAQIEQ